MKARLAFSTISQLSYIILGAALLTPSGILGGIAHVTNHAVSKITLFLCAGSIYVSTHKTRGQPDVRIGQADAVDHGRVCGRLLEPRGYSSGIAASSPSGTWLLGSVERGNLWLLGVLLASSLLTAAYLGSHRVQGLLRSSPDRCRAEVREVPWMVVPLGAVQRGQPALGRIPGPCPQAGRECVRRDATNAGSTLLPGGNCSRRGSAYRVSSTSDHAHFWFEDLPAWGSIYGLVSCVVIIVVSKLLGKLWLMRREDYYDS